MLFIYLLLGLVALGYLWITRRFKYWESRGFLSPKPSFPFGHIKGVGTKVTSCEAMDVIYKENKGKAPIVGIYFLASPVLLPTDPDLMKNIFIRDFSSFHDRAFYYNKEDDPTSANLLTLEGQDWRERRVKLSPIFTSGKMKMMFDIVDMIGDRLLKVLDDNIGQSNDLEIRSFSGKYTADVIGNCAFGLECNCLTDENSEFMKYGRRLFDLTPFELMKFFFTSGFPDISRKLHITVNSKEATDFFINTFIQTFEYREENKIVRNDFVSLLLELKSQFTPLEMAAESFLMFGGGYETSSTLVTFTLYELALNPEIQTKLRDELMSGLNGNDGKLTYDMLFGFKYLDMVVNESLRKYPPIPNTMRKCVKEYQIPGTELVIPKGTTIEMPIYSFHHDSEYYPNPDKFDPERFTDENIKARNPLTFIPFGEGPRNCVGLRFGLMQSKLAILKIVTTYNIKPCEKSPIPMKFVPANPFLAPVGGMWLNFTKVSV